MARKNAHYFTQALNRRHSWTKVGEKQIPRIVMLYTEYLNVETMLFFETAFLFARQRLTFYTRRNITLNKLQSRFYETKRSEIQHFDKVGK